MFEAFLESDHKILFHYKHSFTLSDWPAIFRRGCTTYLVRRNLLEIKWKSEVLSLKLQGVSVNTLREVNFSHAQSFSITIYLSGEKIDGIDSKLVHYIFYSTWLRILIQQVYGSYFAYDYKHCLVWEFFLLFC